LKLLVVVDVDASPVEEGEKVSKEQEAEGEDQGERVDGVDYFCSCL
jgi:hypothetical protein